MTEGDQQVTAILSVRWPGPVDVESFTSWLKAVDRATRRHGGEAFMGLSRDQLAKEVTHWLTRPPS